MQCKEGYEFSMGVCSEKCRPNETKINGLCVGNCRSNDITINGNQCIDRSSYYDIPPGKWTWPWVNCESGYEKRNGQCYKKCNTDEKRIGSGCIKKNAEIYNRSSRIPTSKIPCMPGLPC
jgi:hypothetical protein